MWQGFHQFLYSLALRSLSLSPLSLLFTSNHWQQKFQPLRKLPIWKQKFWQWILNVSQDNTKHHKPYSNLKQSFIYMLQTQDECPAKQIIKQPLLLLDNIQFFLFNITYCKYNFYFSVNDFYIYLYPSKCVLYLFRIPLFLWYI